MIQKCDFLLYFWGGPSSSLARTGVQDVTSQVYLSDVYLGGMYFASGGVYFTLGGVHLTHRRTSKGILDIACPGENATGF